MEADVEWMKIGQLLKKNHWFNSLKNIIIFYYFNACHYFEIGSLLFCGILINIYFTHRIHIPIKNVDSIGVKSF